MRPHQCRRVSHESDPGAGMKALPEMNFKTQFHLCKHKIGVASSRSGGPMGSRAVIQSGGIAQPLLRLVTRTSYCFYIANRVYFSGGTHMKRIFAAVLAYCALTLNGAFFVRSGAFRLQAARGFVRQAEIGWVRHAAPRDGALGGRLQSDLPGRRNRNRGQGLQHGAACPAFRRVAAGSHVAPDDA